MQARTLLLQLILSLSVFQFASSFSMNNGPVGSSTSPSRSLQSLRSASLDENEARPKWMDLPSPSKTQDDVEKYDGVEIGIGRVAMVGFVGLFINEVVSGESFGQQFVCAWVHATGGH